MSRIFASGRKSGPALAEAARPAARGSAGQEGPVLLGVGEFGVVQGPGGALRTLALGSCVALILRQPERMLAGMTHVALPSSSINPGRAAELPGYFADTGAEALLRAMAQAAGMARSADLVKQGGLTAMLVGGANVLRAGSLFNIGERNVAALRKELAKRRFASVVEDVGGTISRSVRIDADTGLVLVNSPGRGSWEVRP